MPSARTSASRTLAVCGILFICAAAFAWAMGGIAFTLGPLHVSATDPARLLMEGSVALLAWAAVTLERDTPRVALIVTCILVAYYVALVAESSPRRVGDGHEYIAMARQLSAFAPPNLSRADIDEISREMSALPGYGPVALDQPRVVAADGRHEFMHFWLYPLVVAPILAVVRGAGAHWNLAFTIVNLALLAAFAWCAAARLQPPLAILLASSPVIWWIDKAHVEVFNYALVGTAVMLLASAPRVSVLLLGLVTAQNPAFATILGPVVLAVLWTSKGTARRDLAIAAAGAAVISCVHPAYYFWRLGTATPLAGTVSAGWPGLTAILTPVADVDLGLCWWFPALPVAIALAATTVDNRTRNRVVVAAIAGGAAALLVLVATSGNINHGATPGLSRYGVWLTPCAAILFQGAGTWTGRRRTSLAVVALCSVGQIAWTSHPKLAENSGAPTSTSSWVSDHLPRLYDPLPEVFAERYTGLDGAVALPVASRECGKVLLSGRDRADVRWPIPCAPAPVPDACRPSGVLCYANRTGDGYVFSRAPWQPGFGFVQDGSPDLLWRGPADFDWLPVNVAWSRMSSVVPLGSTSPIRGTTYVARLVAFQNARDFVAFITTPSPWLDQPRLRLSPFASGTEAWWADLDTKVASAQGALGADGWVDVPSPGTRLLIVRRRAEAQ